jgi:hypothetical protein
MLEARPGIVARAVQALRYTISGVGPGTWMGPLQPLAPMAPPETAGRQFDYPVGYNLSFVPRSTEPVGFLKLRLLADRCDLLRLVIERQKDLLESLDWTIKPREVRPGERPAEGGFQDRIAEIRRFFDCPDGVHDWAQWLRMVLEDLAVIDAVSLYRRRDRLGRLAALEPLDGATIKVLLDASGRRPMAPDPAYQQILKGIPAVDYSADELLYYPRNPRTNHAYGYSPVEQIIRLAETAIERLGSQRAYFTHGNVSDGIFTGPAGWQTDQIKAWQGYWDALFAGNVEQRRAGWWVPAGTQYQALKQPALKDEFDEWLARLICFAFSTSPTPFVKAQNRATAETQQQTAEEGGLAPIMAYVKRLVDRVIATDLGCPDLEFVWSEDREFDPLTAARIDDLALRNGSRTVNEVRDRLGLDTLPGGDQPMVLTPTGYVLLVPVAPQKLGKIYDEDEHPRQPAGSPDGTGGQFASKDGTDVPDANANPLLRRPDETEQAWRKRLSDAYNAAIKLRATDPAGAKAGLLRVSAAINQSNPDFEKNNYAYLQHVKPDFFYNPEKYNPQLITDPRAYPLRDQNKFDQEKYHKDDIPKFIQLNGSKYYAIDSSGKIYDISGNYGVIHQEPPDLFTVDREIKDTINRWDNEDAIDRGDYTPLFDAFAQGGVESIGSFSSAPRAAHEPEAPHIPRDQGRVEREIQQPRGGDQRGEGERRPDEGRGDETDNQTSDEEHGPPPPPPRDEPDLVKPPYEHDDPVTIKKSDAQQEGLDYEEVIRQRNQNLSYQDRTYDPGPDSPKTKRTADDIAVINGRRTAVEAKYVRDWDGSLYNPTGRVGDMPFSKKEVAGILAQARDYCANFEGGVIFYTNSVEFADYYTKLFKDNGLTNFRFVIAPAQYE